MSYKIPKVAESTPSVLASSTSNLGITLSTGTFSVTSASGSALSASNKGIVYLPSAASPGVIVAVDVTADQTFVDDSGSSTIVGNLFGFGSGETMTGDDVPFFIYAVMNDADDEVAFAISRTPAMSKAPATADIGQSGTATADTNHAFFLLGSHTIAEYDTNPCIMIGSFRMRLTTSGGDWTVQTLDNLDGIGRFQERRAFSLGTGVFGAASGTYFKTNGGTAPVYNTQNYDYCLLPHDGMIFMFAQFSGSNTGGAGGSNASISQIFGHQPMGTATAGRGYHGFYNNTIIEINLEDGPTGSDLGFVQSGSFSTILDNADFSSNPAVRVRTMYPIYTP